MGLLGALLGGAIDNASGTDSILDGVLLGHVAEELLSSDEGEDDDDDINYYIFVRGSSSPVGRYETIYEAKRGMALLRNHDDRKDYVCRDVMGRVVDIDH